MTVQELNSPADVGKITDLKNIKKIPDLVVRNYIFINTQEVLWDEIYFLIFSRMFPDLCC